MSPDGQLRVLQVHTRYRLSGGEEAVVEAERALLTRHGVEVEQLMFDNAGLRESRSPFGDARLALEAVWSRTAYRRMGARLRRGRAHVVHVHNTFSAASASVYAAASELGVPVVQTLHNYRFVCPKATVFRDGRPCTDCVGRAVPWPAVVHACVRGSHRQSLVVATGTAFHRLRGTYGTISRYIALTEFQRNLMIAGGLPADRITVVPNFLDPDPGVGDGQRSGLLYVGRLSPEKGIHVLAAAAPLVAGDVTVIGSGPMEGTVRSNGHLRWLGPLDATAVRIRMQAAIAVVAPSVWFEGFPLVLLEAFATGTPVIASRIGSLAGVVEEGMTGLLVEPNDAESLSRSMTWALEHPLEMAAMGRRARDRYERRYRGDHHWTALAEVYSAAMANTEAAG